MPTRFTEFVRGIVMLVAILNVVLTPEQVEKYRESVREDNKRYDWDTYASRFAD